MIRHSEGPDTDNAQFRFSADDDLDPVGYLRSLCVASVFGKNHTFPLRPTFIIAQNPKHSRRSAETLLPLAAQLHLSIDSCCHKDQLESLSERISSLEPWYDPIMLGWWGRVLPNITELLLPAKTQPNPPWPNHWKGSDAIWLLDTVSQTIETYQMFCEPVKMMDEYCFRSSRTMPSLPRPDWGPWKDEENATTFGQTAVEAPVVRVEKLLADGSVVDVTRLPSTGVVEAEISTATDDDADLEELDYFTDDPNADPAVAELDYGFRPKVKGDKFKTVRARFDVLHGGWQSHTYPTKRYKPGNKEPCNCPSGYNKKEMVIAISLATIFGFLVSNSIKLLWRRPVATALEQLERDDKDRIYLA